MWLPGRGPQDAWRSVHRTAERPQDAWRGVRKTPGEGSAGLPERGARRRWVSAQARRGGPLAELVGGLPRAPSARVVASGGPHVAEQEVVATTTATQAHGSLGPGFRLPERARLQESLYASR